MKNPIDKTATAQELHTSLSLLEQLPFSIRKRDLFTKRLEDNLPSVSLRPIEAMYRSRGYRDLIANQIYFGEGHFTIEPEIPFDISKQSPPIKYKLTPIDWENRMITDLTILYGYIVGCSIDIFNCWRGFEINFKSKGKGEIPFVVLGPNTEWIYCRDMCANPPSGAP